MPVENKDEIITVRFPPSQAEEVRKRADADGERVSTWLRLLALREVRKQETAAA